MRKTPLICTCLLALVSGCAGPTGRALSPQAVLQAVPAAPVETATVTIHITVPQPALRAKFVSPSTQSFSFGVGTTFPFTTGVTQNITSGQPNYSASLQAPLGSQTFTVGIFDGTGGGGNLLAQGTTAFNVQKGTTNQISLTALGVPAQVALNLSNATPLNGVAANDSLTVTVKDADGNPITGQFSAPVTVTVTDPKNLAPLPPAPGGPFSFGNSVGSVIPVNYNGGTAVQGDKTTYTATTASGGNASTSMTPVGPLNVNNSGTTTATTFVGFGNIPSNISVAQLNGTSLGVDTGTCGTNVTASLSTNTPPNYVVTLNSALNFGPTCTVNLTGTGGQTGTITVNIGT